MIKLTLSLAYNVAKVVFFSLFLILNFCMCLFLQKIKTPWKDIWTSVPLWALLICHLGQNWGYWMLLTMLPDYLNHVFKFNITSVSILYSYLSSF